MRSLYRFSLPLLLLATLASAPGLADEPSAAASAIDLAKTRALYRGWIQRKSFPDAITLAYHNTVTLQALDGSIAPDTRERLLDFIKRCQRDDGGFVSNPKYGSRTNIVFTYFALAAAHRLAADDAVAREQAIGFVKSLLQPDGSIRAAPGKRDAPSLAATFFGVQALRLLNRLDLLDRTKTKAYVLAHRTADGGFGVTPRGGNSPRAISMAVRTLATLGELDEEVKAGAVRYLENAIGLMGTRGPRFRALSSMQTAVDILAALESLGLVQEVITDPLLEYVTARYVPENGGFGPAPGLGTTPPSTYQALYCLATLGKLGTVRSEAAVK